jgi:osmotically-inducible protein OsmY
MKPIIPRPILSLTTVALLLAAAPLRSAETDGSIVDAFEKSYVYKTYLGDSVKTTVKDGVVTLTGTVPDGYHRNLAETTAANLPGVVRVDDQLETRAEVTSGNADAWIGRKVMLALLFHRHVSAGKTVVAVKQGVVTLSGPASSMAEKELTTAYAMDIDGVTKVVNNMAIQTDVDANTTERIDDASITAQVKTALTTHHSTSSVTTRVETLAGNVVLSGIARNAAEKTLVTKLVNDIEGVKSVDNRMTVADDNAK